MIVTKREAKRIIKEEINKATAKHSLTHSKYKQKKTLLNQSNI